MYLLDTNVISETIKKNPHKNVLDWFISIGHNNCALSVLTLGEIRKGIEKLEDHVKKQKIIHWMEFDLVRQFKGKIINIDPAISDKWGYLSATTCMPSIDGLIAASALVYNCKLVTRNTKDFKNIVGLEIINPWEL
jgi:hypothetical protein